jgi:hypothetical protein
MGNQMFQYAFAYLAAKKIKTSFLLDTNWLPLDLVYFNLKFPYCLLHNKFIFKVYNFLQKKVKFEHVVENMDCTVDISEMPWTNNTDYIGFFQEGSYYKQHKSELQKLFTVRRKYERNFFNKYGSILDNQRCIVVSVRLGDYRKFTLREYNNANMLLPLDWYREQLAKFDLDNYTLFFISDELDTVKNELSFPDKKVIYVEDSVINQFQLLLHADVCIISNSTFAWWGAFLNYKNNATIIAPNYFVGYWVKKEYPNGIQNVDFNWV